MKSLLAFTLLAGMTFGQGQPAPTNPLSNICTGGCMTGLAQLNPTPPMPHTITLPAEWCDGTLKMGNSTRAVKDVFPEECAPAIMCDGSGITHCIIKGPFELNGDFSSPPPGTSITIPLPGVDIVGGQGRESGPRLTGGESEPEDVPAVKIDTRNASDCRTQECTVTTEKGERAYPRMSLEGNFLPIPKEWGRIHVYVTGCADKTRILETAEDGDKWCRKPQRR
jgi:hypothetical protein